MCEEPKISYSLYLWHWPLIVLVGYGAFRAFNTFESLLLVVSATLIATISWKWIEEPIRQRRVLRSPNAIFGSGLASALLLLGGLFLVVDSKGLPDRVDPEVFDRWQVSDVATDFKIDDCHGLNAARVRQDDICLLGGEGEGTFALVGDSHARALAPVVFEVASELDLAGYQLTGPGFGPTPGRLRVGSVSGTTRSDSRVDALRSFLRERPEIQTAVVTSWWHRYATGSSYRGQKAIWRDRDCHDHPEPVCVAGSLSRSLDRLLKEFSDIHFVFLDDVPVGWDLHPKSYFRAEFAGRNVGVAALPYTEAQDQFNEYAGILRDVASNNPNATFSPLLFESLCDSEGCSIVDDRGGLLYADGDHLSSYGALSLKNEIRAMFLENVLDQ